MKCSSFQLSLGFNRWRIAVLLIALGSSVPGRAAISEGPKPQNAVEAKQREKLLFEQAILSNEEKLRVGLQRYEARQAGRQKILQTMTAQLQARQQVIVVEAGPAAQAPTIDPSQWLKPFVVGLALLVLAICGRYFYNSRQRERAAAEFEKLF